MLLIKIICCFSTILLFKNSITAQNLNIENPIRFLALGDSYTIGQSVAVNQRWPEQLADSLESKGIMIDTLRIIAQTGWRTDNLINAIKNQNLEEQEYNLVSLLIGVNNQYQNRPFSQYTTEFPALLDSAIRYAGGNTSHVFVVSIPDYAYTPFGQNQDPSEISMEIDQYNSFNKEIADSMGVTYFDITPISRQGLILPEYVASDGLHPSGEQYTEWVKLMLEGIDAQLTSIDIANQDVVYDITISPNPTTSNLLIELKNTREQISSITICKVDGRKIFEDIDQGNSIELSVSHFPRGLYILKLKIGGVEVIRRFVKV